MTLDMCLQDARGRALCAEKRTTVNAPDLRNGPPPRWNESIDGVIWLPRFAAKARAYDAGTLGGYLYGQSPIDHAFLKRARLDYPSFLELVRSQPNDRAVLTEIERRAPGATAQLQRWSGRLSGKSRWFMSVLDVDDGYAQIPLAGFAKRLANVCAVPIVFLMRALR
jgi:Domain of unknown function (DUF5069)